MLNKVKEKLKQFRQAHSLAFLAALITALLTYILYWMILQRAFCLNQIKAEINKFQNGLLEIGYDIAYDKAEFSSLSPFSMVKFENLKIYTLDPNAYFEWKIPQLKINAGMFNAEAVNLSFSREQDFQKGTKVYPAEFPIFDIELKIDKKTGLKDFTLEGMGLNIQGVGTIGSIIIASQRMAPHQISDFTPFFENHIELKDVTISEDIDFPLLKKIERIYVNANIIGILNTNTSFAKSFDAWVRLGGIIDLKQIVINWNPLLLVGRGDLYFNDKLEPNLHLNTSSKAFVEILDKLQDNFLERKGVFVAKILLNNKSFKINENDKYNTVTTPININSNQILIENIPVKTFISKTSAKKN